MKQESKVGYRDILRQTEYMKIMIAALINRFGDSNHPTYMGIIENGTFRIFEEYR